MAAIKDLGKSSDKWARRAGVAQTDYVEGVKNPRTPWAEAAASAAENWKSGIQQAAQNDAFAKGVKAAGNETWQKGAEQKGANRYAEGVSLATDKWQEGFKPYAEVIASLKLPPRGPKGSPQNLQRVAAINQALRAKKTGQK